MGKCAPAAVTGKLLSGVLGETNHEKVLPSELAAKLPEGAEEVIHKEVPCSNAPEKAVRCCWLSVLWEPRATDSAHTVGAARQSAPQPGIQTLSFPSIPLAPSTDKA